MNTEVKDFIGNCTAQNDYLQNNTKKPLELVILFSANLATE